MELYRSYDIKIREVDRAKADAILMRHCVEGDIDDIKIDTIRHVNQDGTCEITYWIGPYIYEDLEAIVKEFKEAGIQII